MNPLPEKHTAYNEDIIAWACEQAKLLRARRFDELDIERIAEEIEDVGKREQHELAGRTSALLAPVDVAVSTRPAHGFFKTKNQGPAQICGLAIDKDAKLGK